MKINKDFLSPEYYYNRELSWLLFNDRILQEAQDESLPLFERLKFLSITASNLDEFYMIRVASLKDMVNVDYDKPDMAGMRPMEQLLTINERAKEMVSMQYETYNKTLLPLLKDNGLHVITSHKKLSKEQKQYVDKYFLENVYPVLTPMAVDASRPFPLIRNKSLNIAAILRKEEEIEMATVQVPGVLERIVEIPGAEGVTTVILLEEIIMRNIQQLFLNYKVECAYPFRIMRNADLTIEEEDAVDLLEEIEKQIKKRQWGEIIRLEVSECMDKRLLKWLRKELSVKEEDIFKIHGPLDLTFLMKMYGLKGFASLKNSPIIPAPVPRLQGDGDIFSKIRKGDILLHHPYQTFDPVVEYVKSAATDKNVLAIKQTLYRVSGNSPIVAALAKAAENGKQVTVLVELKARFDEENNIGWARMLEKAGCHVIYGLVGLKTHCKITLVVRKEKDGIRRYVHLGTGNYNDSTAKLYTDMGLFTCNERIGEDATAVFNMISGYSEPPVWNKLYLAPLWLRDGFVELIRNEAKNAKKGKKAQIIAKMNSVCDKGIISELYAASAAGVKIQLIVRGICCVKVGIPGVSDNITVRSIVGTFLEHSRIFYFENGGEPKVFMGSADWMPRNLDKRVEIVFPVEDKRLKKEIIHILDVQLKDTLKAHLMNGDGSYTKQDLQGKELLCAQEFFIEEAAMKMSVNTELVKERKFVPIK